MQDNIRILGQIDAKLRDLPCESIARQCNFTQRRSRKITPRSWVKAFCCLASGSSSSLRHFAWILGLLTETVVSKQAVRKRLLSQGSEFLKQILAYLIAQSDQLPRLRSTGVLSRFERVLVQDSTMIKLPSRLAAAYPGCVNQTDAKISIMRIQAVLDILSETFVDFSLSGYTRNDQAASADIIATAEPGDLILRDLGYFVINVFKSFSDKGIFFISRLKPRSTFVDPETGNSINLLATLRKTKKLDQFVIMGAKNSVPVRLVAIALPQSVANERRRKARLRRDKRNNYSKEYYALLSWQILITNVDPDILSAKDLSDIYGLRWQIEIVFKTWKSYLDFESISQNASAVQVEALIYARLIYAVLFHVIFWRVLQPDIDSNSRQPISFLKAIDLISHLSTLMIAEAILSTSDEVMHAAFYKHTAYDSRKRKNYVDIRKLLG
jgi:hypothetical protein